MQIVEAFQSGRLTKGKSSSGELRFLLFDVDMSSGFTEQGLIDAVAAYAPSTFANLTRQDISVEQVSNEVWTSTVTYGTNRIVVAETAPYALSFSTQGESANVQQALAQTGYSLTDQVDLAEVGLSIGVDMDGVPQGVDIVVPKFEFSETHVIAASVVEGDVSIPSNTKVGGVTIGPTTLKWTTLIASVTGSVNDNQFRGFAAKSVLFAGVNGSRQEDGDYEVSFAFVVSPNKTLGFPKFTTAGTTIETSGGGIETVAVEKAGHDYLWFHSIERFVEGKTPRKVTQARAAFVATVYPQSTFSAFVP